MKQLSPLHRPDTRRLVWLPPAAFLLVACASTFRSETLDGSSPELSGDLGLARAPNGASTQTTRTADVSMAYEPELLFDFSDPTTARRFTAVDDRVMGGVSQSALRADGGVAAFEGDLSTEQGGGFASVRSVPEPIDLSGSDGVALHVRGDGRAYKLRIRTDDRFDSVNYQASFATTAGAWTTIHLPFETFQPTHRGQLLSGVAPLDPSKVKSFGLLVAGNQVGAFRLEIKWISSFGQG